MTAILSLIRIVPSWCYWLLALVGLCVACELHGRSAKEREWQAKMAAAAVKSAQTNADTEKKINASTVVYVDRIIKQKENINALPKIQIVNDCAVPADISRVLNNAQRMPENAGTKPDSEVATKTVNSTCASELDIAKRNYAEVCIPNALQLEEIQKQWGIVEKQINGG